MVILLIWNSTQTLDSEMYNEHLYVYILKIGVLTVFKHDMKKKERKEDHN